MKHSRVVVTGGAGFIGSHLSESLLKDGVDLCVIDNLNHFYPPDWKRENLRHIGVAGSFEFHRLDICAYEAVRSAISEFKPDCIVHLAAYAGVRPSLENPRLYEQVNISGTVNLLEIAREFKIPKFVFGSSSSVYGNSSRAPFREEEVECRPISPYAATKLSGELLCYTYSHLFGIETACLRFFTVFGPRQRPDLAIHKFTAMLEGGVAMPVFGDGSTGRDYTYVDDIVAGIRAAMDCELAHSNGAAFDVFNLGNCSPVTLNELISKLEDITGHKAIRDPQPTQAGDVSLTWADTNKSTRMLGYRPTTPLRLGLEKFVAWYRLTPSHLKLCFESVSAGSS
jgi:UDP-glucuronate 4-epimerase